jgi:hypothetical protein
VSQTGALVQEVTERHLGKQMGMLAVPAWGSQMYSGRQPPGDWLGIEHCLKQIFVGPTPEGFTAHWLPAKQSVVELQALVQ